MIPQIASYDTFGWAGGYPLLASSSFDAGAAPAVIVSFTTSSGYAYLPAITYGGQTMTLLARTSTADTGQTTTWLWGLVSPPAGEQTILITASDYCAPATGIVIALADVATAPFGETDADIASPTLALSVETTASDCLLIAIGQAQSTSGVALTADNGFSLIASASEGAATNILSSFEKDAATPGTYSVTLTAPFNHVSGALVAIRGFGSEGIGVVGIGPGSAVGAPAIAIDRQAAVTGIGSTAAAGLPDYAVQGQERVTGIAPGSAIGVPAIQFDAAVTLLGIAGAAAPGTPEVVAAGTFPLTLASGESIIFRVTFAPTVSGAATGALVLATSIGTRSLALSGTGTAVVDPDPDPISRLHIEGNQFVNAEGSTVRLKTVNWNGAEGENHLPHGCWMPLRWTDIVDHIKSLGFNCIRFPFSGSCGVEGVMPAQSSIHAINADLSGISVLDAFEKIFDYCAERGLYIVLDHHRRAEGAGADGSPIDGSYTQASWLATWGVFATRFADHPAVIGADVHNEPHNHTWADWATLAEACGNHILSIAPNWLIFVEGVGSDGSDSYWWGGYLKGVATRPIVLSVPNKVVYSPHDYGQSVESQTWLAYDGQTEPAGWPNNLYDIWRQYWGYIYEDGIAPIWIGEFGGHFGYDAATGAVTKPHATYERQWLAGLLRYLGGDFNGDGTPDIATGSVGMSAAFWTLTYNSRDTGGLLLNDFITEQTGKIALLAPLLED